MTRPNAGAPQAGARTGSAAGDADTLGATLIVPDWPAPAGVRAVSTTRRGGVSSGAFASLNLGFHPGDAAAAVAANRAALVTALRLPTLPAWLRQVHGGTVLDATAFAADPATLPEADASIARAPGAVCVVMTADCLPVLLCDRAGREVAAAHAGWRGLARGVLANAVAAFDAAPPALLAWLGPAIGPAAYEVGDEVRAEFLTLDPGNAGCFVPSPAGRWLADLYRLARRQLIALGLDRAAVYAAADRCTYSEPEWFYSYRRDGSSGRMASLIWLENHDSARM